MQLSQSTKQSFSSEQFEQLGAVAIRYVVNRYVRLIYP
jgi:hypothetical protein